MSSLNSSEIAQKPQRTQPCVKYAQTNIQLFNQLYSDGYSGTELSCVFNAYQLAATLYTGCFRASGKPFIAHLVGTASILSSLHTPVEVVAAGLLHAAYLSGDFGDNKKGITEVKRQNLISVVGGKVEGYITRYTALKWNSDTIPVIYNRLDSLDPLDHKALLIRLANELE
ncbi:MAG: HD domain-containing protein [Moorea sp. SIO2I5]|nr:HD domain-containing protein [Moorena sp. SIO2I5]